MRQGARAARRIGRAALLGMVAGLALLAGSGGLAGAKEPYDVERFVVAERKKDQIQPRVAGSWIVWKDYRNLSLRAVDESPNGQIYGWDLASDTEVEVSDSRDAGDPAISGTLVVWTHGQGEGRGSIIRWMDLVSGERYRVSYGSIRQERPAISGTLVVWQDNRNGNWDIFARDLTEVDDFPITENTAEQSRPAVSGRTVVWEDWRDDGPGPNLYGYDLDSQRSFRITSNHDAWEPAIAGRWVVWVGRVDQGVFARHLDDGTSLRLSTRAGPQSQPAIGGELVVWTDERYGDRDIFGYDLAERREFTVIRADEIQDTPHVDGTTIVWSDSRGPNRDIMAGTIALPRQPAPTATVVAQPAPTGAPAPAPAASGSRLERLRIVGTGGEGAMLRASPGGAALKALPEGTEVLASSETQQAGGRTWRKVRDPEGTEGWVAAEFLGA